MARFRFRSLHTRLSVLYAGLFAAALLTIAAVAQLIIHHNARNSVAAELTASGTVYDRLWALREQSLADAADVLARDFGFRSAVATGDRATIESALVSLRRRAHVSTALVVDLDGGVVGAEGALARALGALPFEGDGARRDSVTAVGGRVYRTVISPILAPTEIGWVVFAVRLDAGEMRSLQQLSSIPLIATILHRDGSGHWISDDGSIAGDAAVNRLVARSVTRRPLLKLSLPSGDAFAIAKPLRDGTGRIGAVLLIRYPLGLALNPYRPLQYGIALAGLIGLVLVLVGSSRLARSIAKPLAALDRAAQALEEGTRSEVHIGGDDEIGRLAESFNRMSAGIVERENRIAHLAFHDALTGLPNRVALRQALELSIARAARGAGQLAVLCLDLDGFKGVNDTLGHPAGDALLQLVSAILREAAADAFVARLGGDEFAIVLADGFDSDRPRALAQSIINSLSEPLQAGGHQIATGTSIGIALYPDDGIDPDVLLKNADLALYRAKSDGRTIFRFFEQSLDEAAHKRRELELDLRDALRSGQFQLAFQPIIDLTRDRVGCMEALLRWNHPTRGPVSPADFIPVAEETGLIIAIGEWVLHEACRAATRWPEHVRIAVNVSPLQFRNAGFQAIVMQALSHSKLAAPRLEVEITETVFLDGEEPVVSLLHRLRAMGIRIVLDDFGTGYSSLSYLRRFPFDQIKIDQSFVRAIVEDRSAAAIVRAIVDLANALDMETTAEGVETAEQLARLREQGCGNIQGYHYSRPMDEAAAGAFLSRRLEERAA